MFASSTEFPIESKTTMADHDPFDIIYEEGDEELSESTSLPDYTINLPDPIVIRGAGNVTM